MRKFPDLFLIVVFYAEAPRGSTLLHTTESYEQYELMNDQVPHTGIMKGKCLFNDCTIQYQRTMYTMLY